MYIKATNLKKLKMELLYFIVGSIFVIVLHTAWQSRKIRSEYVKLSLDLNDLETQTNRISTAVSEDIIELQQVVNQINNQLSDDSYHEITVVNERLDTLDKMANAMNNRFSEADKIAEKQLSAAFTELQQLKNNIKALNQDPNLLDR